MQIETPRDLGRDVVLMFRLGDAPFIRNTLLPLYPLPERFLSLAFWVHRSGVKRAEIFEALPEQPVDPTHHKHAWAMLADAHRMMMNDVGLRVRVRGEAMHGSNTIGYHTSASYEDVTAFFASGFEVLQLRDVVAERQSRVDDPQGTLDHLARVLKIGKGASANSERLYDYANGGGDLSAVSTRLPQDLGRVFAFSQPSGLNEVGLRVLDVLVRQPKLLARAERALTLEDPVLDQHALWRELLLSRGLSETQLEALACAVALDDTKLTSRTWWLLGRAAADLPGFIARRVSEPGYVRLLDRLLFAAMITWDLPGFRDLAAALLADHAEHLSFYGVSQVAATRREGVSAVLRQHEASLRLAFSGINDPELDALFQ
ncbi:MAG: hypothetical protein JNK72_07450 [Myxococcales bacterium]|nr:hypothetical protein [Myxococcales bacterium]